MSDELLQQVLHEHGGLLTRIATTYEARAAQRQDLLQDIALALWRALPGFRQEASLKTFVARVAHNRGVDHVINQKRHGDWIDVPESLADDADPERDVVHAQQRARLLHAMRRLPLNLQAVLSLALEGFSHGEISATLGITTNNVDVRLARARAQLRKLMGAAA